MIEFKDFPHRSKIKSEKDMIYDINYPAKVKFRQDYIEKTAPLLVELDTLHIGTDKTLYEKEIHRETLHAQIKEERRKFREEFYEKFPLPKELVNLMTYDYAYFGNKYERN